MNKLRALWNRLGKTERMAIAVGVPLVALAALVSSRRKPAEEEKAPVTPTGTPQVFGPTLEDFARMIEDAVDKVTPPSITPPPTPPAPPPVAPPAPPPPAPPAAPNLAGLAHQDLVNRADDIYRSSPGQIGPYLDEIERRFRQQGVGPDGAISINAPYWRKGNDPNASPRAIYYVIAPKVQQIIAGE